MTTGPRGPNLQDIVDAARHLTESLVPIILLEHGLKVPVSTHGTWTTSDDPDDAENLVRNYASRTGKVPNIGIVLHPKMKSPVVCLDVDGMDEQVVEKLKTLGISRSAQCWRQLTGRRNGHVHVFFWWGGSPLKRIADRPVGLTIDLLANGFAVAAPSDTYFEPDGGGPYRWIEGHGPLDISTTQLEKPPEALIDWWLELTAEAKEHQGDGIAQGGRQAAWALLGEEIPKGVRHTRLCRIAGHFRNFHPEPVVQLMLQAFNKGLCQPPLPPEHVQRIVHDMFGYAQQNGLTEHPDAIVPSFPHREVVDDLVGI